MNGKKVLLICKSVHHSNTLRIAKAMGQVFNAEIIEPDNCDANLLAQFELIGFGSGIYNGKHHERLFDLLNRIDKQNNMKAFIFSTSTVPLEVIHKNLKEELVKKGFNVIADFYCKGFMDYSFSKNIFGGLNKGRPNDKDLRRAQDFANNLAAR